MGQQGAGYEDAKQQAEQQVHRSPSRQQVRSFGVLWGESFRGLALFAFVARAARWVIEDAEGTDGAVYHKAWDGAGWWPSATGYENLGGKITSKPVVVSWGANRLDIFVRGTDDAVWHKWWNGSAWGPSFSGWESLGGKITSRIAAASWAANRLDLFVRGTDGGLYHKAWNGSAWVP